MLTNTGQIPSLLRPGLNAVFGNYATYPAQWTEIFKTYTSHKYFEEDVEMKYLGAAEVKPEGSPFAVDSMGERVKSTYIHRCVSIGFPMTRESIINNLYPTEFPQQALALKQSLMTTKNIFGANVLNNAFSTSYPVGDGQPACSVSHPIDNGTYANTFTTPNVLVDFSEAGLEAAIVIIQKMKAQSGILTQTMARKLIVPPELQFAASRLLNSSFRTDVGNNDISAVYHGDYIPEGYKINMYLTSPTAWFIITDATDGLKLFQREQVQVDVYQDMMTKTVMASALETYSFGISNPRGLFGSPGV